MTFSDDQRPDDYDPTPLPESMKRAGVTVEEVKDPEEATTYPDLFRMVEAGENTTRKAGLWEQERRQDEETGKIHVTFKRWLCGPFTVLGRTERPGGGDAGLLIAWKDQSGREQRTVCPAGSLHGDPKRVWSKLAAGGLMLGVSRHHKEALTTFLTQTRSPRLFTTLTRGGWQMVEGQHVFSLPNGVCFPASASVIMQSNSTGEADRYREAGTLKQWQEQVAAPCLGNPLLMLALGVALAGPTLAITGGKCGGFNFIGQSRRGKSTALEVAASVWGAPTRAGMVNSWETTGNGIELLAERASGTCLILDEQGRGMALGRNIGAIAYKLADGAGKVRDTASGEPRPDRLWQLLFLSSGEKGLCDLIRQDGGHAMAGQEVRLVDLRADGGAGPHMPGLFTFLHGLPHTPEGAAQFAEALGQAVTAHHGVAGRAWLERLTRERNQDTQQGTNVLQERLWAIQRDFVAQQVPEGADGQVRTVAQRMGVCAAALVLACEWGLLPWQPKDALAALGWCLTRWQEDRGHTGSSEQAAIVQALKDALEAHGSSRFQLATLGLSGTVTADMTRAVPNRLGFLVRDESGDPIQALLPDTGWREVFANCDPKSATDLLTDLGVHDPVRNGKGMPLKSITHAGRGRYHVINLQKLAEL